MKSTYKAVEVSAPGMLRIVERQVSEPGPGQVRIRVEACGICHTDAPPSIWRRKKHRQGTRRMTRKSDVARTKSISNVANNQAVRWMIGSKPNANSHVGCFRGRRRARKPS